jgi:hypothetical protein
LERTPRGEDIGLTQGVPIFRLPEADDRLRTERSGAMPLSPPHPADRGEQGLPVCWGVSGTWDEHITRKPMLLLRLSGLFLLRFDARALSGLLFQEPPRNARGSSPDRPADLGMQGPPAHYSLPWHLCSLRCALRSG